MGYGIRACDEKVPGKAVGGVDCPLEDVRKAIDIIALLRVYDTTLIETIRLCEIFSSLGGSSVQHLLEELFGGSMLGGLFFSHISGIFCPSNCCNCNA